MKYFFALTFLLFTSFVSVLKANTPSLKEDVIIVEGISTELELENIPASCSPCSLRIESVFIPLTVVDGTAKFNYTFTEETTLTISSQNEDFEFQVSPIPLWMSIIPPLIAILLALTFKEVVTALLIGIFSGAFIIHFYSSGFFLGILFGFTSTVDHYLVDSLNDSGHLSIILFSMLIGGMVSIISKNGGMQGVVNQISKYAKTAKTGQLATWFLGIAIFFDDYANTLIVGNTMRPVTDRLKISREKLAYLVDSTAAPIAAIAFVTTWIGAELGYIESGTENIEGLDESVYSIFISSLAYSFYPIFALLFMLMLILKERDFGPMYKAELKARNAKAPSSETVENNSEIEEFSALKDIPHKSANAIIPVFVVIIGTVIGLLCTGWDQQVWDSEISFSRKLSTIIGNADSYKALLWSSLAGLIAAVKLSVFQRIMNLEQTIEAAIKGFKTMLSAIIILVLAWALALVIEELHTAELLTSIMSENVSPYLVPTITFLLAAVVAFSTGSSWGTMAILYPLMLPASWAICQSAGVDQEVTLLIFHNTVACVLAGAVLGDHCSPISDTTILSSLASSCNHINHVKTQMPYALTVGSVAVLFGTLPAAFGIPFYITLPVGAFALYLIVVTVGKKIAIEAN